MTAMHEFVEESQPTQPAVHLLRGLPLKLLLRFDPDTTYGWKNEGVIVESMDE